jgi:hypothetical protein
LQGSEGLSHEAGSPQAPWAEQQCATETEGLDHAALLNGGLAGRAAAAAAATAAQQPNVSPRDSFDKQRCASSEASEAQTAAVTKSQLGRLASAPSAAISVGFAAGAAAGMGSEEEVTEYAVVWSRLLQEAGHLLQASVEVWQQACNAGSWEVHQAQPDTQQHLAACGQLYCAAAIVRCVLLLLPLCMHECVPSSAHLPMLQGPTL